MKSLLVFCLRVCVHAHTHRYQVATDQGERTAIAFSEFLNRYDPFYHNVENDVIKVTLENQEKYDLHTPF